MLPGLRKASFNETPEEHARNVEAKRRLINQLSTTVKELQKTHLEEDLEIDKNDEHALMLCTLLEAALLHGYQDTGLKMSNFYNLLGKITTAESMPSYSFWDLLVNFTHKDVRQELQHLSHITTPIGQCRAWVRLALNDCLIESYFDAMLSDRNKLRTYYKPSAFMLEDEMPFIMISFLQGIVEFKFNLNYNTPSLNNWTGDTLAFAGIWQLPKLASHPPTCPQGSQRSSSRSPTTSFTSSTPPRHQPVTIATNIRNIPDIGDDVEIAKSVTENDDKEMSVDGRMAAREVHAHVHVRPIAESSDPESESYEEKPIQSSSPTADSQEEKQLCTEDEQHSAVSPVPMVGSNKLGVSTGWSSAFDTGAWQAMDPNPNKPYDNKPKREVQRQCSRETVHTNVKQPETYTNLLSDYTVQGQDNFKTSVYDQEDSIPTKMSIPKAQSPVHDPHMPGFEVVPHSSSVHSEHIDDKTQHLMSILTQITNEQGLDYQNYQCNGCGQNIGMIYGEFRVCKYDSCYYCFECHADDEHVIPARIIYNWDLRKHSVCRSTKLFLLQIEEEPLLNIDETNPSIYAVIDELQEIRMLRKQLQHLKGFLFTCKEPIAEEVRRRIWPREYLWDDIHQYSLLDLIQTSSGQLAHHLKKIISYCKKHVYKCQLCCQKGFICEICNDPKIIYPFQIKVTTQCPECKAVFHKACITDRKCPKCVRRHKLKAAKSLESNALEFNSPLE